MLKFYEHGKAVVRRSKTTDYPRSSRRRVMSLLASRD